MSSVMVKWALKINYLERYLSHRQPLCKANEAFWFVPLLLLFVCLFVFLARGLFLVTLEVLMTS